MAKLDKMHNRHDEDIDGFRQSLLAWYDRHARDLPWRARGGQTPDPYHVWLSEVMLQQTVVAAVRGYFEAFLTRWPTIGDLAAAPLEDVLAQWAGLGYYARARNLHRCARAVTDLHGGRFPDDEATLLALPGIGRYTAAAISAIAFNRPATVVDGNVERVVARYYALRDPVPAAKPKLHALADGLMRGRADRPGDFAQAMMDLGATICTPQSPACGLCPVAPGCAARREGIQASLPAREKKAPKPRRIGYVYLIHDREGRILAERRREKGLLGGMAGLPTSDWIDAARFHSAAFPSPDSLTGLALSPVNADIPAIRHVFTHFELELIPLLFSGEGMAQPPFFWHNPQDGGMPTVFRKALDTVYAPKQLRTRVR